MRWRWWGGDFPVFYLALDGYPVERLPARRSSGKHHLPAALPVLEPLHDFGIWLWQRPTLRTWFAAIRRGIPYHDFLSLLQQGTFAISFLDLFRRLVLSLCVRAKAVPLRNGPQNNTITAGD